MMYRKILSKEEALQKLKHFCGYQERCHSEVKEKLYSLGIRKTDHDDLVATLIEENYLNEERFAIQFAGGRYRVKNWGRKKIMFALREKQVNDYSIKKALQQIDEADYKMKLNDLVKKRYDSLKQEQYLVRKKKTIDYLLLKGYEFSLVTQAVNKYFENNNSK
ncbi:MAG: RecX family transcriptional regulator [Chitinophagaceae bacterium]|nr:RecX family transcriptional regulator [Chitinophagaceae bacterium]